MKNKIFDIIIVGAGPAGMTCAIYGRRSNKSVLIIEKESIGGQMSKAPKVENYPGIASCMGDTIADAMFTQIIEQNVDIYLDEVKEIKKIDNLFHVSTITDEYLSRTVVVATGSQHKTIDAHNEEALRGKGVYYCAVCDGPFYKNKEVVVIGDANSALQYALELSNYCSKVNLCMMFDRFFADEVLVERLLQKANVNVYKNLVLKSFEGNQHLEKVCFLDTNTNENKTFFVEAAFVAIGMIPQNEIIKNLVDLDKVGYVKTDETLTTKTPGLFVAGDCRTKEFRQISTAVADGAIAALKAINYLN